MGERGKGVGTWATSRESVAEGKGEGVGLGKCGRGWELPRHATCGAAQWLLGPVVMEEGHFPEGLRCGGALWEVEFQNSQPVLGKIFSWPLPFVVSTFSFTPVARRFSLEH
jgi:hypothetical protein